MRRLAVAVSLGIGALAFAAAAHDPIPGIGGKGIRWKSDAIAFIVNPKGSKDVADESDALAIRLAFEDWNAALGGALVCVEDSPEDAASADVDDPKTHRILFDEDDETGFFPNQSAIVALTPLTYNAANALIDADIVFNGRDHQFSTNLAPGTFDIRNVAAHEIGHFLGLGHSPFFGATMFPYTATGQTIRRSLSSDDRAGARALYAANDPAGGRLSGFVFHDKGDGTAGAPAAGAHVSLRSAGDGRAITGTLTKPNGAFTFAGVEPGIVGISVAPLDGPMTAANLTGSVKTQTDFGSLVLGGAAAPTPFAILAGNETAVGAIVAPLAADPTIQVCTSGAAIGVVQGSSAALAFSGSGIVPGSLLWTPCAAIAFSQVHTSVSGEQISAVAIAGAGAPAGLYDLLLVNPGGALAVEAGAVEVLEPAPVVQLVTPSTGALAGGTALTIAGSHFSAGARVIVGDRLATGVVVQPNSIACASPAFSLDGPAGALDVVVVNPDGQEDRLVGAFTVEHQLSLTGAFPKAVAATGGAVLHLTGDGFAPGARVWLSPEDGSGPAIEAAIATLGPQQIDAVVPALSLGSWRATVELPAGGGAPDQAALPNAFAAVGAPDPAIADVLPASAPVKGGTHITILGAGFASTSHVSFGADPATGKGGAKAASVHWLSDGELDVVVPAAAESGVVTLLITNDLGQASGAVSFEYVGSVQGSGARGGGGGGGGCAGMIRGFEPPSPSDQAGGILSTSLALLAAAAVVARRPRAALARTGR